MRRGCTAIGCAALVGVLVLVAGTAVGRGGIVTAYVSKHKTGPFDSGAINLNIAHNEKSVWFKAANNTDQPQTFTLTDESFDPGSAPVADYKLRWYRGKKEVTRDARGAGYDFDVGPSAGKRFRTRVIPRVQNPGETCVAARFSVGTDDAAAFVTVNDPGVCG